MENEEQAEVKPLGAVRVCEMGACREVAVVGIGPPIRWMCQQHYEDRLKGLNRALDQLKRLARGEQP